MKKIVLLLLPAITIAYVALLHTGCANIVPPTGGPKDTVAPILMNATPKNRTKNFVAKKVIFSFNEFVEINNIQENLVINPIPKVPPVIEARLRNVYLYIKDTLDANTTYSYNLGNALRDINENNTYQNFTYAFSTGNTIDSMQLVGKVVLAETGKVDSTLQVILHKSNSEDSIVAKVKPRYMAKLNGQGQFKISYLPKGIFYIYALQDNSGQKKYTSPQQLFAFNDSAINTTIQGDSIILRAYAEEKEEPKKTTTTKSKPNPDKKIKYDLTLQGGEVSLLDTLSINFVYAALKKYDSTALLLTNDKGLPIQDVAFLKDSTGKRIRILHKWIPENKYKLILKKEFAIDSNDRKLEKNDTIQFAAKSLKAYASVRLRFTNADVKKTLIIQFVKNDIIFFTAPLINKEFTSNLFEPGEYDIRILFDENKNGKWDPGNFYGKKIQPELVVPIERKITIKANWENEIDIQL
jgi:Bacterial Ig-like domain